MKPTIEKKNTILLGFLLCLLIIGANSNGYSQVVSDTSADTDSSTVIKAADPDTGLMDVDSKKGSSGLGAFPVLFSSEQTGFAGGGGAQMTFKKTEDQKASAIALIAFYTQKKQYVFSVGSEIYLHGGSYKFSGELAYLYFPDTFYGIGNKTKAKADEEDYTARLFQFKPTIQKKYYSNLYLGLQYGYYNSELTDLDTSAGKLLKNKTVTGSKGGIVSGAGIVATWDSRDDNLYPTGGSYHQFSFVSYGSSLGSEYTFNSYLLDLRHYRLISDGHILAFRGVMGLNTGDPSFQMLNQLGVYLRGYTVMRYIDKNIIAFQAEYRRPLVWKLGMVAFVGFGEVADEVGNFSFKGLKPATGFGIRFPLIPEQKVNLRIDIGIGKDDSSFDINIMEVF